MTGRKERRVCIAANAEAACRMIHCFAISADVPYNKKASGRLRIHDLTVLPIHKQKQRRGLKN